MHRAKSMSHSSENPEADRRALRLRLRKIAGQLKGIETMIEGDYECAEVLNQLVSARRAIKSLAEKIINDHLEHCLETPGSADQNKKQLREVAVMLKRYVE
jgi:DNA-binding FrmR family transcriptional regulator